MVSRVYGLANGNEVIFRQNGNTWDVEVPWTDDGKYTAEIFAEDEAGNLSHLCSMLFVISGHELQACLIVDEKQAIFKDDVKYSIKLPDEPFALEVQERGYQIECVVCGDRAV